MDSKKRTFADLDGSQKADKGANESKNERKARAKREKVERKAMKEIEQDLSEMEDHKIAKFADILMVDEKPG